jgi:DNA-binding protein H-NS
MSNYKELLAQREVLDRKIEEARQVELASAIGKVRQLIAEFLLSAADCGFHGEVGNKLALKKTRTVVAPKYRSPDGKTWTGRGKAPKWLAEFEAQGRTREDFKI